MKLLVITFGLIATTLSSPTYIKPETDGTVSVVHSSDGAYTLDVNLRDYGRKEERHLDGTVIGEYSVPDASGTLQTFKYMAGKDGYRIISGPLPVAPVDHNVPAVAVPVFAEAPVAAFHHEAPVAVPVFHADTEVRSIPSHIVIPNLAPAGSFIPHHVTGTFSPIGFQVHQGAPQPVEETPEVKAARAEHLIAHQQALHALG